MIDFTKSPTCQKAVEENGNTSCLGCRLSIAWQTSQVKDGFTDPHDVVCPLGFKLGERPVKFVKAADVKHEVAAEVKRPDITPSKVASFVEAMLTAPRVSNEVEQTRLLVCSTCSMRKVPTNGTAPYCGMCGCKVSSEGWRITNLASYEESIPKWGCKHPFRGWTGPNGEKPGWPLPEKKVDS